MPDEAVILLLGLLTVAAWAASAFLAAGIASGRARPAVSLVIAGQEIPLALLVAAVTTAGSLWLSYGAGFTPCNLCWYQRIAAYPLVPILTVAAFFGDRLVRRYVLPLCGIGAAISVFHILVERFPWLEESDGLCDPNNPCAIRWVEEFGFLTIPMMALSSFVLIALLMAHTYLNDPEEGND